MTTVEAARLNPYDQTGGNKQNGEFGPDDEETNPITTCEARCTVGYENKGTGSTTYKCTNDVPNSTKTRPQGTSANATAHWDGGHLKCVGKPCKNERPGFPEKVANANLCDAGSYADSGDPLYKYSGSLCRSGGSGGKKNQATCKDGYEKQGGSSDYICDYTGHWVVGSMDDDGANPNHGGGPLVCTGQSCGTVPHGVVIPVDDIKPPQCDTTTGKDCWPFVAFGDNGCTDSSQQKGKWQDCANSTCVEVHSQELFYSDQCTGKCTCIGFCDKGYTETGEVGAATERRFNCRQEGNKPYFETTDSHNHTSSFKVPAVAQTCKAVKCPNVLEYSGLDGGISSDQHLVPAAEPVTGDKFYKRCGNSNGAAGDDPGVMRFDQNTDTHHNMCFASCQKGYTSHETSQTLQLFTCGDPDPASGQYSGQLRCSIINCKQDEETMKALVPNGNFSTPEWKQCQDNNKYQAKCKLTCNTGFTRTQQDPKLPRQDQVKPEFQPINPVPSKRPWEQDIKPWECQAREKRLLDDDPARKGTAKFPNGDQIWNQTGTWTGNLQCLAVQCHELPRPPNTWYSHQDSIYGEPSLRVFYFCFVCSCSHCLHNLCRFRLQVCK